MLSGAIRQSVAALQLLKKERMEDAKLPVIKAINAYRSGLLLESQVNTAFPH